MTIKTFTTFSQQSNCPSKLKDTKKSNVVDPKMSAKDLFSKDGKCAQELKEAEIAGIRQSMLDLLTSPTEPRKADLEYDAAQKALNASIFDKFNDNNSNRGNFSTEELRGK